MLFSPFVASSQPIGANINNPINAGTFPGVTFSDNKSNSTSNNYGNDIGYSSDDIFYKVTLTSPGKLVMSTCQSTFDTYIYLLETSGNVLASNDDNNYCVGLQASLKINLQPGTYYVVVEGWNSSSGNILTDISFLLDETINPGFTLEADKMLQNLDKSRILTGVLYDRVMPLASVHAFNSVQPDTSARAHFIQAYTEIYNASYNKSNWLTPEDIQSIALGKYLNTVPEIPVGLAKYQFNVIDPNAIANGQIIQIDSVLYDASPTSNPYITRNTIIASPLIDSITTPSNTVLFNFSQALTINKSTVPMTSMNVDFGNGGAPQGIALNTDNSVSVSYPSSGYKTLKFTIGSADGNTTTTNAVINIRLNNSTSSSSCDQTSVLTRFTSDLPFQGYDETTPTTGQGDYKIFYATNGACDQVLRKPLIILDGFDPLDTRSADDLYNKYLNNALRGRFGDNMRALGYDIVVLNFPEYQIGTKTMPFGTMQIPIYRDGGADYIERNAMVLIKLIKLINSQKQGTEKLVIIGPSMGGLISRYALKYMEQRNDPHQTKLWISFDSPHNGANIAIGDQYFLDFYAGMSAGAKKNRDEKINSVAAKQMLVHHYTADSYSAAGAPGFRDRFAATLNDMGFPSGDSLQPFRKIALIDGSLGGVQVNSPGQKGFTFDVRHTIAINLFLWKWKIRLKTFTIASAQMYFTPGYGTQGSNVLEANKPIWNYIVKEAFAPSYTTGYDTAPGGTFPTQQTLADQGTVGIGFADSHTIAGQVVNIVTAGFLNFSAKFYSVVPTHSFINTKSALAFTGANEDLAENISNRNLFCTGETPFDSYFGDFNLNREHVELWTGAIDWITKEIDDKPQSPSFTGSSYITGLESFCGSATYVLNNLPAGSTINWSATGPVTISGSTTGSSVNVVSNGNGTATINASVTSSCGNTIVSKSLTVGSPAPGPITTDFGVPPGRITAQIDDVPGATSYKWYLDGVLKFNTTATSVFFSRRPNDCGTGYYIAVEAVSSCGTSPQTYVYVPAPDCAGGYIVSPNPSSSTLVVSYEEKDENKSLQEVLKRDFEIKLYDNKSQILRSAVNKDKGNKVTLETGSIPNGNYFLHITEGKEVIKRQVIISH